MGTHADDAMASSYASALVKSLSALGWREGMNCTLDFRWASNNPVLFERHAAELLAFRPDVLVAQGSPAVLALRRYTTQIPIVFTIVTDPLGQGFVKSLAQPGGNVTGFTDYDPSMAGKWMELLSEVRPRVRRAAVAFNPPTAPFADMMFRAVEEAAPAFSVTARKAPWTNEREISATMRDLGREGRSGAVVLSDLFNLSHRDDIIYAAALHKVPVVYFNRSFALAGGLMSYGANYVEQFRRAAGYIDRLLKGASAAELPVQQPDKFDLVVNLKTAEVQGFELRRTLVIGASEVIE
jgi:putative ABC transport system substrate-binding protein